MGNLEQPGNNLIPTQPHRKIYFISGLGADERVFQFLKINGYQGIPIQWELPLPEESLPAYAARLLKQIDPQSSTVLIGVSFGGIVAQELAKLIACERVIIISSIKSEKELPWSMRLVKYTRLHLLFPVAVLKWLNLLTAGYYFGTESKAENVLLRAIIRDTDTHFMQWAIAQMMQWTNYSVDQRIIHIHGTHDRIFPIRTIRNAVAVSSGGHFMIVNRARQISEVIGEALKKLP